MKKSVLTILALISLMLLIPNIVFGGAEPPPCSTGSPGFILPPPYMGNVTFEWVPPDANIYFWGGVLIYGELKSVGKGHKNDIIIKRKDNIVILIGAETVPFDQVSFLGLEPVDLQWKTLRYSFSLEIKGVTKNFGASSANDLDYKTDKLFTVDVVVMEIQCQ